MEQERQVGHIVSVDSLTVYVKLEDDLKSLYKAAFMRFIQSQESIPTLLYL